MKKNDIKVEAYLISRICDLDEYIQKKYAEKFGLEDGQKKYGLSKSYYKAFLSAKISTDVYKLERDLERKEIDRRENNWEILCDILKEHFGEEDANKVKDAFNIMAQKEVQRHILFETKNPIKKMHTAKEVKKEIEENLL